MQEHESILRVKNRTRLDWAKYYVTLGWAVLPLYAPTKSGACSCGQLGCTSVGKHPRTKHGCKDATTNVSQIENWWNAWPDANIGIATGSRSGLVVVDVDPRHSGDPSWERWSKSAGIPNTLKATTGGGGYHLYYLASDRLRNRAGVLPGVDIRGEDGYVVAPGSVHASQRSYDWVEEPVSAALEHLPEQLKSLLRGEEQGKVVPLRRAAIPCGERNTVLTSIAGSLRKHGVEEEGIRTALEALNVAICSQPLAKSEISGIAKSIARYSLSEGTQLNWKSPSALPAKDKQPPTLTARLLPEALRSWAEDISERMQVPLEFIAAPMLVGLSSIVGRQIGIYPKQKDDWLVVPNLWGAVVARPGFFKSPAMSEAMRPIEALATKARIKYESEKVAIKAKEEMFKAKIDGLKETIKKAARKGNTHDVDRYQKDLEDALTALEGLQAFERRYKTNDATVEKLGALLNENPNGLLVFRDELSGWLRSLQKSGHEGNREFYLEAWNGYGSYTVDRIGRGTIHIPALCLSLFGGLQPGKLDVYVNQALSNGAHDDGLLQRLQILVYPETPKKWRNVDRKPNDEASQVAKDVFASLAKIETCGGNASATVYGVHFAREAQEEFNRWRESLENRLRTGRIDSPLFESHIAKYRSMVPSLALIFHLVGHYRDRQFLDPVGVEHLTMAIEWASFLEAHAMKVYAGALHPGVRAAHALAGRIKDGEVKDGDSLRSIYRHHWSMLDTLERLECAIAVLEDVGWVQVESLKGNAKTTECIRINKAIFDERLI